MNKKISIVIPMYNAEKTIKRCLESILNQSYDNLEIIIVNDGSDDQSKNIVLDYQKNDKRIKLINIPNQGVSHARNVGLKEVSGDYIQFVDSDDDLDLNYFKIMTLLMEENDCECAICNNNHPFFTTHLTDYVYDMKDHDEFLKFYQHTFAPTFPWNKLYKAEILKGCFFEEDITFAEDEVFFCQIVGRINKIVSTSKVLYHYFISNSNEGNSAMTSFIKASKFWINHTSIFYREMECLPAKIESFERQIKEKMIPIKSIEDVLYQRLFDYAFYQYAAYYCFGISEDSLYLEMMNIFKNTFFHKACKVQEQYGLKFRSFLDKDLNHIVYQLNHALYVLFDTYYKQKPEGLISIYFAGMIFAKYFVIENNDLDNVNIINKLDKDLKEGKTKEAKFALDILNQIK